jgi:hypothetical protein
MSDVVLSRPPAITREMVDESISLYRQQRSDMQASLDALESNYAEQKRVAESTLAMLHGAIAALESLIENLAEGSNG